MKNSQKISVMNSDGSCNNCGTNCGGSCHGGVQPYSLVNAPLDCCPEVESAESISIDTKKLSMSNADIITATIVNDSVIDINLLIGAGPLSFITGVAEQYGIANPSTAGTAVDGGGVVVGLTDDWSSGFTGGPAPFIPQKIVNFNRVANSHAYIISRVKVFDISGAQVSQPLTQLKSDPDGNLKSSKMKNVEHNVDLNYVQLNGCAIPVSFFEGMMYKILAGNPIQIELEVMAVDAVGNYIKSITN